jgi:divalent metal cation (Fe/Co/Zn/Cd) transporter
MAWPVHGERAGIAVEGGADDCCGPSAGWAGYQVPEPRPAHGTHWLSAARKARLLAWVSLVWMTGEAAVGLLAGRAAGSAALTGWALSSGIEGLASVIVIWRFTGSRIHSGSAEHRAQRGVALSFWLLAPYVAADSVHSLLTGHRPGASTAGIAVTALSLIAMPVLGQAKHRLAAQLRSAATAGEGTQNLLCAASAAAVLLGLAASAVLGWWWLDACAGLAVAAVAIKEGRAAWRGSDCC